MMRRDLIIEFEELFRGFEIRILQDLQKFHSELFAEFQQLIEELRHKNLVLQMKLDESKRVLEAMDNRRQALFNTERNLAERLQ
jgi:hypothetical protein